MFMWLLETFYKLFKWSIVISVMSCLVISGQFTQLYTAMKSSGLTSMETWAAQSENNLGIYRRFMDSCENSSKLPLTPPVATDNDLSVNDKAPLLHNVAKKQSREECADSIGANELYQVLIKSEASIAISWPLSLVLEYVQDNTQTFGMDTSSAVAKDVGGRS